MQEHSPQKDIENIVAKLTQQEANQDTELPKEDEAITPLEGKTNDAIHIHYFPDAIVILREGEEGAQETHVIDSTVAGTATTESSTEQTLEPEQEAVPPRNGKEQTRHAMLTVSFNIFLILSGLILQSSLPFNSPTATVTLIPKSQTVTLTGMLQLGRVIAPITLTQSQTVPTTGKGHQDAKQATGYITFYNGQLTQQFVPAGTLLTGHDGVQVITDQSAYIPAADLTANPPVIGHASLSAHALRTGASGNIQAYDINEPCCSSVVAKNTSRFTGGQDERNFQTVTRDDIDTTAATLKTTLAQSMQAALHAQIPNTEDISLLPCAPTVRADHKPSEEAVTVKVTVSGTCSAVAYDPLALKSQAKQLLTQQASKQLSKGYSWLGDIQVTVKQATVTGTHTTLEFFCQGTWVYALDPTSQEHIKMIIAGKTKQEALRLLTALPGIERVSMNWDESTKLPNNPDNIHIVMMYGLL